MKDQEKTGKLDLKKLIFNQFKDPENWKNPTKYFEVDNEEEARIAARAIAFFVGGVEIGLPRKSAAVKKWRVGSLGYYHYIGA